MRAETALGVDRRRGQEIQSTELSVESRSHPNEEDLRRNEYYDKVYKAKLVPWTWAEIDLERLWRAEEEEGQIVRVSYLSSDLVFGQRDRDWS